MDHGCSIFLDNGNLNCFNDKKEGSSCQPDPFRCICKYKKWTIIINFVVCGIGKNLLWKLQTLVQAYTVGVVVSMYDTTVVLEALFITLTVLLGLTAYTFQTKRDFSFLGFG